MHSYSRIFACLDGSQAQESIARKALAIAQVHRAELIFGHVIDSTGLEMAGSDILELTCDLERNFCDSIADIVTEAKQCSEIPAVSIKTKLGRIHETLIEDIITQCKPDLVVCGERGLSNIQYALLGSVSTQLIRKLECDVLVAKTQV